MWFSRLVLCGCILSFTSASMWDVQFKFACEDGNLNNPHVKISEPTLEDVCRMESFIKNIALNASKGLEVKVLVTGKSVTINSNDFTGSLSEQFTEVKTETIDVPEEGATTHLDNLLSSSAVFTSAPAACGQYILFAVLRDTTDNGYGSLFEYRKISFWHDCQDGDVDLKLQVTVPEDTVIDVDVGRPIFEEAPSDYQVELVNAGSGELQLRTELSRPRVWAAFVSNNEFYDVNYWAEQNGQWGNYLHHLLDGRRVKNDYYLTSNLGALSSGHSFNLDVSNLEFEELYSHFCNMMYMYGYSNRSGAIVMLVDPYNVTGDVNPGNNFVTAINISLSACHHYMGLVEMCDVIPDHSSKGKRAWVISGQQHGMDRLVVYEYDAELNGFKHLDEYWHREKLKQIYLLKDNNEMSYLSIKNDGRCVGVDKMDGVIPKDSFITTLLEIFDKLLIDLGTLDPNDINAPQLQTMVSAVRGILHTVVDSDCLLDDLVEGGLSLGIGTLGEHLNHAFSYGDEDMNNGYDGHQYSSSYGWSSHHYGWSSSHYGWSSPHYGWSSPHYSGSSPHYSGSSSHHYWDSPYSSWSSFSDSGYGSSGSYRKKREAPVPKPEPLHKKPPVAMPMYEPSSTSYPYTMSDMPTERPNIRRSIAHGFAYILREPDWEIPFKKGLGMQLSKFVTKLLWNPNSHMGQFQCIPPEVRHNIRETLLMFLRADGPELIELFGLFPPDFGEAFGSWFSKNMHHFLLPMSEEFVEEFVNMVVNVTTDALSKMVDRMTERDMRSAATLHGILSFLVDDFYTSRFAKLILQIQAAIVTNEHYILLGGKPGALVDDETMCRRFAGLEVADIMPESVMDTLGVYPMPITDKPTFWKKDGQTIYRVDYSSITGKQYWTPVAQCSCPDAWQCPNSGGGGGGGGYGGGHSSSSYYNPYSYSSSYHNPHATYLNVWLVNGTTPYNGHVLVETMESHGGHYICDDNWDEMEARVVCRQLGYLDGDVMPLAYSESRFGFDSSRSFIFDNMNCYGHEASIWDCQHGGNFMHDCQNSEIAGVDCRPYNGLLQSRISNAFLESTIAGVYTAGLLVVNIDGYSGYVCNMTYWGENESRAACHSAGFWTNNYRVSTASQEGFTGPFTYQPIVENIICPYSTAPNINTCTLYNNTGQVCDTQYYVWLDCDSSV